VAAPRVYLCLSERSEVSINFSLPASSTETTLARGEDCALDPPLGSVAACRSRGRRFSVNRSRE
jgi:hypothetical protein